SSGMKVHASPRNFNNDWGMPLTVLSCPDDAQALVVELGARGPGEIARLCRIARPHVGVITGIGTSHIEFFGSREGIARSKSELLACLPADGLAVVPAADDFLDVLAESTPARVATVGPGGHVGAERVDLDESGHAVAVLRAGPGVKVQVRLPLPGRPLVRNAAMAVRVAMELGVGAEEAAAGIAGAKPTGWRMETTQFGGRTIVNDAYNASPASTSAGLRTVAEISRGRPMWAVLGEMAELGDTAPFEHLRMGRLAADLGYERVVAVGAGAAEIATGAGSRATRAQDAAEAAELVARESPPDAVVLVKGSLVAGLGILPSLLHKVGVGG
ncbi:MAG TPA: UDP-N-acetylmuramoyl-tripeptide--D-alanyl-D-alanine ligase, partial [Actinomycetota bacterium]|nr:UDP-N-acetylmuramoyl-tripeptide--D-alanyl-D-alanine ligase [Actinomycetota bacterium]